MERGTTVFPSEGFSWTSQLDDREERRPRASADEGLVRECLAGSQEAWSELIDKYRNLIYSIPIRQGLSREDASEVFQEICLKLVAELPGLREARSLPAWLIRVTSHECFHWLSRHRRMVPPEPGRRGIERERLVGSAEALFVEIEREQTLREAVSRLAGRCRQLVRMLFFTAPRPSYEEIAMELAIAKGSIGFFRLRCLECLRKDLEQRGFE